MVTTARQRIRVLRLAPHEIAAAGISFEVKTGEITGRELHRYVCACGNRGVWHPSREVALDVAEMHALAHASRSAP